ncbi:tail fiber protein [Escherichia coli]|nr:tail fiber protein [Escherichia coli]
MGNLNETEKWEENIYQLETSDPVLGGADGISNRAPRQLANRTKWLKKKTEEAAQSLAEHVRSRNHPDATLTAKGFTQLSSATNSTSETLAATSKAVKAVMDETNKKAPLNSPALTGTPTTPTASQGTNSTQIASTAFVMAAIAALVDSSPDALNTLNELATALGNDPNFATTITNALAGKQPKDATLTALAKLATSADKLPYFTGADRAALTALTSVGRAILGKTSTQGVLDYLGLGWPTATPPAGWLQCNGATFTKEQYPVLARVYPTLRLPDLRGEFIRGWDDGRKVDTGRALLSSQSGMIEKHRHIVVANDGYDTKDEWELAAIFKKTYTQGRGLDATNTGGSLTPSPTLHSRGSIGNTGGRETRPRNIAFNYIVRAA